MEQFGYRCNLMTDSEVVTYVMDLMTRKHELPLQVACMEAAPTYHSVIESFEGERRRLWELVRKTYRPAMINGPFSICVGFNEPKPVLMGLTDRKKLRPLIAATSRGGKTVYLSSEECAIRILGGSVEDLWAPLSGNPVIVEKDNGLVWRGEKEPLEGKAVAFVS